MPVNGKRIILLGTLFPMLSAGVLAQSEEVSNDRQDHPQFAERKFQDAER